MAALVALLDHLHPKFKGTVKGGAVGSALVALLLALGVDVPPGLQDLIVALLGLLGNYRAPGSSKSNGS